MTELSTAAALTQFLVTICVSSLTRYLCTPGGSAADLPTKEMMPPCLVYRHVISLVARRRRRFHSAGRG